MPKDGVKTRSCWACNKQYVQKDKEIYCSKRCTDKEARKWEESQEAMLRREQYGKDSSERAIARRTGVPRFDPLQSPPRFDPMQLVLNGLHTVVVGI